MTIHHINVEQVGTSGFTSADITLKISKVRCKQGRGYTHGLTLKDETDRNYRPPNVQIDPSAFLVPIIEQTTRNAVQAVTTNQPFAITGPIARADVGAIVEQMQALPEHLRPMYQHLGLALIDALADRLPEEQRRALSQALTVV